MPRQMEWRTADHYAGHRAMVWIGDCGRAFWARLWKLIANSQKFFAKSPIRACARCARVFVSAHCGRKSRANCIAQPLPARPQRRRWMHFSLLKNFFSLVRSKICRTFAPKIEKAMYRTPYAYIADVEVLTGKSYGTARRIMADIKKHYNLSSRQKPTMEQVKNYLVTD